MSILNKILTAKRADLQRAQQICPDAEIRRMASDATAPRDFHAALIKTDQISIIAEIKKASPSAGLIRADFDPVTIAAVYEKHGAAAISVLTEHSYFQGSVEYLKAVRRNCSVPVLRKDFIFDPYQLAEARANGADAVLLIAEVLEQPTLVSLVTETGRLGMQALVEIHDDENLDRALDSGSRLIGINNRNLHTFETRLTHTLDLMPRIPASYCVVSESGIGSRQDLLKLKDAGVRAVLVGETLMRASDIGAKLDELLGSRPLR
jgi:indole-3-glycerol phosphate synthase